MLETSVKQNPRRIWFLQPTAPPGFLGSLPIWPPHGVSAISDPPLQKRFQPSCLTMVGTDSGELGFPALRRAGRDLHRKLSVIPQGRRGDGVEGRPCSEAPTEEEPPPGPGGCEARQTPAPPARGTRSHPRRGWHPRSGWGAVGDRGRGARWTPAASPGGAHPAGGPRSPEGPGSRGRPAGYPAAGRTDVREEPRTASAPRTRPGSRPDRCRGRLRDPRDPPRPG